MDEKYIDDDAQLAQMGHKPELKRHFSLLYEYHFRICRGPVARLTILMSFLGRCWVLRLPFSTYVLIRGSSLIQKEELTTNHCSTVMDRTIRQSIPQSALWR